MRIGYCSPFNPQKSGISDFSEELLPALAKHMEVVVFSPVKISNREITDKFKVFLLDKLDDDAIRNSLDIIVYHVGNNESYHADIVEMLYKYPGIVELHDVCLHNMVATHFDKRNDWKGYVDYAAYCHGNRGKEIAQAFLSGKTGAPWETHTLDMCMNRKVIEAAKAIVVHSELAKQMVLGVRPDVPICNIMHHSAILGQDPNDYKKQCRKQLDLPETAMIFGSFGYATFTKRIIPILDALKILKDEKKDFLYLIVGQAHKDLHLEDNIAERGLADNVLITGFTELDDFTAYIGACDFGLNLRYPTQGESSGSLHRMFSMGKPIIVTDAGTFSEYPEEIVIKTRYDSHEIDDIYQAISKLISTPEEITNRGEAAIEFVNTKCNLVRNAELYTDFFSQIIKNTWSPEYEDILITHLCEMGTIGETYIRRVFERKILGEEMQLPT